MRIADPPNLIGTSLLLAFWVVVGLRRFGPERAPVRAPTG
jgi:hypothetical protein